MEFLYHASERVYFAVIGPAFLYQLRGSFRPFVALGSRRGLVVLIPLVERIKNQLDAAGDAQLVKDPVQVVTDGMLRNLEPLGNFAVLHAVGHQADYIFLAARQQRGALGIVEVQWFNVGEGVDQMFEVFVARPDLPFVDRLYAFG